MATATSDYTVRLVLDTTEAVQAIDELKAKVDALAEELRRLREGTDGTDEV